ncbi:hypothetical protein [Clavibacter zhangzhiyongii]|uniref:hypothetical protein n=1 Tax=Clavibacter TaxID=1573 RepID=UPI0039E175D4
MNEERPNEKRAKRLVEEVLCVHLEHHDKYGGVDYLSRDGDVALEVTSVTNGEKNGARKALKMSEAKGAPDFELQGCWIVLISDDRAYMKTFVQRAQPAIAELELAGESHFDRQRAVIHITEGGPLASTYRSLLEAAVERASHVPHRQREDDPDHKHRMIVSSGSGGSASGSDEAIDLLLDELRPKLDNLQKLAYSTASQRHLFVWLNDNTAYGIERPLSHKPPSGAGEFWGLPSGAPKLDPLITHLWVVHQRSGSGWLWDGAAWRELQEAADS